MSPSPFLPRPSLRPFTPSPTFHPMPRRVAKYFNTNAGAPTDEEPCLMWLTAASAETSYSPIGAQLAFSWSGHYLAGLTHPGVLTSARISGYLVRAGGCTSSFQFHTRGRWILLHKRSFRLFCDGKQTYLATISISKWAVLTTEGVVLP